MFKENKKILSIVGHNDIAVIMSGILGQEIVCNRESVILNSEDILIVGQYVGGRLPEGTKTLPENSEIKWFCVSELSKD